MTRIDRTPNADPPPRRRKRWLLLSPLLVLLVWWLWPDGRLAKARELEKALFSEAGRALSPEEQQQKFRELRTVTRDLSDSQRKELFAEQRKRREDDLRQYIALSPAEKQQRLDRDIQRAEQRRQQMQANPNGGRPNGFGGGPGGPNGPGGRPSTPEDRERRRQERLDHTTPEFREMSDQYRRDMEARRKQLGLPPPPGRPGRGA